MNMFFIVISTNPNPKMISLDIFNSYSIANGNVTQYKDENTKILSIGCFSYEFS